MIIHYRDRPIIMSLCLFALAGSFMVSFSTAQAEAAQVKLKQRGLKRLERMVILGFGGLVAPLSIRWFEQDFGLPYKTGIPMVISVSIIAVLANYSVIIRLKEIRCGIQLRNQNLYVNGDVKSGLFKKELLKDGHIFPELEEKFSKMAVQCFLRLETVVSRSKCYGEILAASTCFPLPHTHFAFRWIPKN